jgi:hypothetical protein
MEGQNKKQAPATPFELALAAKRGTIPPDSLRGAAKLLYKQHSREELKDYARQKDRRENKPTVWGSIHSVKGKQ